ncbi:hypothetical protein MCOR17_003646, partial [Pyricularia oryzae]
QNPRTQSRQHTRPPSRRPGAPRRPLRRAQRRRADEADSKVPRDQARHGGEGPEDPRSGLQQDLEQGRQDRAARRGEGLAEWL